MPRRLAVNQGATYASNGIGNTSATSSISSRRAGVGQGVTSACPRHGVRRLITKLGRPVRRLTQSCSSLLVSELANQGPGVVQGGARQIQTDTTMARVESLPGGRLARLAAPSQQQSVTRSQNYYQNNHHLNSSSFYQVDEMEHIKSSSREHKWYWSETDKSHECVVSEDKLGLCFHPHCSESAAACRAAEPLKRNGNYYYWEIHVHDKIYGTSVMFGLCTAKQRLHANDYCNLVGLDEFGWSLTHKGLVWHGGTGMQYTSIFPINQPITVGLLYNTMRGELSFFMDGRNLGVAFRGLNDIPDELYPVVASTAKCTQMRLLGSYCGYVSLLERSCFTLLKSVQDRNKLINYLQKERLPKHLLEYVAQAANVESRCIHDDDDRLGKAEVALREHNDN